MDIWDEGETVMGVWVSNGLQCIKRSRGHGIMVFGHETTLTVDSIEINQRVIAGLEVI